MSASAEVDAHPALTFEQSTHTYRLGARVLPSVTQIIERAGIKSQFGIDPEVLARKAALGTLVHDFTAQLDRHEATVADCDGWPEEGYIRAWAEFREKSGFEPLLIEHAFAHQQGGMWYAGTLDRLGKIGGGEAVVDLKTGAGPERWWGLQLAAYSLAMQTWPEPSRALRNRRRLAVQLSPEGDFKVHEYREPMDTHAFLGALAIETWRSA